MKPVDLLDRALDAGQPGQQLLYAAFLSRCTWVGTVSLLLSFAAELTGLLPTHVPHHRLPELWGQPAGRFAELADWPTGWHWLSMLDRGDLANLLGIAVLCACSGLGVAAAVPNFVRCRDGAYLGICVTLLLVLFAAASGLTVQGHPR